MTNQFKNNHLSAFWGENQSPHVALFSLTPTSDHEVSVDVVASVQGDCLGLSYFLKGDVDFDVSPTTLHRADFLWEKTCLECFFDLGQEEYFELNFSGQGEYNLYHFDSYRTPSTLPPRWAEGFVFTLGGTPIAGYQVCHVGVKLDNVHHLTVHAINPTAILYKDGTPLFYAVEHANPPDFHDKRFWQTLS